MSPNHFDEHKADLLLKRAALAGSMAQQPPIRVLPLAPHPPLMSVVRGHRLIEKVDHRPRTGKRSDFFASTWSVLCASMGFDGAPSRLETSKKVRII
jgi:hypothetical protein